MNLDELKVRIDKAVAAEDYQEASAACLDYLEWHYQEVVQAAKHAGTDHIIAALRHINREAPSTQSKRSNQMFKPKPTQEIISFDDLVFKRCRVRRDGSIRLNNYSYPIQSFEPASQLKSVNAAYFPDNPQAILLFIGIKMHKLNYILGEKP